MGQVEGLEKKDREDAQEGVTRTKRIEEAVYVHDEITWHSLPDPRKMVLFRDDLLVSALWRFKWIIFGILADYNCTIYAKNKNLF